MKKNKLQRNIFVLTLFSFGALTGLAATVVFLEPSVKEGWMGPFLLAAPALTGCIFVLLAGRWIRRFSEATSGTRKPETRDVTGPPGEDLGQSQKPLTEHFQKKKTDSAACSPEMAVVRFLGLLQREGRLLDFLEEDLEAYDDARIGAAVREVHRGCKTALNDSLKLEPVLSAPEGSEVELEEDFDPVEIRLIGTVSGNPPFKGTLRHSGWKASDVRLPNWTDKDRSNVIAPAEIEIP